MPRVYVRSPPLPLLTSISTERRPLWPHGTLLAFSLAFAPGCCTQTIIPISCTDTLVVVFVLLVVLIRLFAGVVFLLTRRVTVIFGESSDGYG